MAGAIAHGELTRRATRGVRFELATAGHEAAIRRLLRESALHGDIVLVTLGGAQLLEKVRPVPPLVEVGCKDLLKLVDDQHSRCGIVGVRCRISATFGKAFVP